MARPGGHCEGVQCLLYYTDVHENGGPTMGVWDDGAKPEDGWQRDSSRLRTVRGVEPAGLQVRRQQDSARCRAMQPSAFCCNHATASPGAYTDYTL
jgi:hypothetical protein